MGTGDIVANDLRNYVFNTLQLLEKESTQQMKKWNEHRTGFLAQLVAAHEKAAESQFSVLKQWQDERQKAEDRAFFVLSLLSVVAVSWLGASLQYKLAPKVLTKTTRDYSGPAIQITKSAPSDVAKKMFGDVGKELTVGIFLLTSVQVRPKSNYEPVKVDKIVNTPNAAAFAQQLYEEVASQGTQVSNDILGIAEEFNNNVDLGYQLWKSVLARNPRCKNLSAKDAMKAGRDMLTFDLEIVRKRLTDKFHYYSSDPPPKPNWQRIYNELERQLWAIWIGQEDLKVREFLPDAHSIWGVHGGVFNESGGFASTVKDSPIVQRLFDLNAPVTEILRHGPSSSASGAKAQLAAIHGWAKRQNPSNYLDGALEGVKRELRPINALYRNY